MAKFSHNLRLDILGLKSRYLQALLHKERRLYVIFALLVPSYERLKLTALVRNPKLCENPSPVPRYKRLYTRQTTIISLPRPADLPLPFTHCPIDDSTPIPGTLILRIADTAGTIHASQGQVGIPVGVRRTIIVDIRHPGGR